jgi:hypothetical protein
MATTNTISEVIEHELLRWPGVTMGAHRFGGCEFRVGKREIGHLHGDHVADLPFSRAIRDELVSSGKASPICPFRERSVMNLCLAARLRRIITSPTPGGSVCTSGARRTSQRCWRCFAATTNACLRPGKAARPTPHLLPLIRINLLPIKSCPEQIGQRMGAQHHRQSEHMRVPLWGSDSARWR